MNISFTTTQTDTLTEGSTEVFGALGIVLNGSAWNLAGGSASLTLAPPQPAAEIVLAGTISADSVTVNWTVAGPGGQWLRAWTFVDATGFEQVTLPYPFQVISSPI